MNAEQQAINQWGQIVAKAWQDDTFKKRFVASPSAVLKEFGIAAPAGVQFRVVENTNQILHLTIPARPQQQGELSELELENVAGGNLNMLGLLLGRENAKREGVHGGSVKG